MDVRDTHVSPNDFSGTDSQRINRAAQAAAAGGKTLVIPRINAKPSPGQPAELWLLDEAILLPSGSHVELHQCHIRLSDRCRDNFFRSANCGLGIDRIEPAHDIYITGVGKAVLEGAQRPRATGDAAKTLGEKTFGTDAGKADQSQRGDWRNIGILMASVTGFGVRNVTIVDSHCWGMSFEFCTQGALRDIHFQATGRKMIDGREVTILNQDGIDLRQGCHDILIENITGYTGDDLIALTAIPGRDRTAGATGFTMVSGPDVANSGIRNVIIRNIRGHCAGGHNIVRLLNTHGMMMQGILIDGLLDTSQPPHRSWTAVKIGDGNPRWGGVNPPDTTRHITVQNITTRATYGVLIGGSIDDSIIANVTQFDQATNPKKPDEGETAVHSQTGPQAVRRTVIHNCRCL